MCHALYLSSSYFGFLKEDFLRFYYIQIRKINGRGQCFPHGLYLNKFGRHPLEDVLCSYILNLAIWLLKEDF
jgi:hypothetical protein